MYLIRKTGLLKTAAEFLLTLSPAFKDNCILLATLFLSAGRLQNKTLSLVPQRKIKLTKKIIFYARKFFTQLGRHLEGASVPTGEQILGTNLCRDKRELRGSGFHLASQHNCLSHGERRQPEGGEWSGDLSRSRTESAATYRSKA